MRASGGRKILAPVVLYSRNVFSVVPEEGLRVLGITVGSDGVMLRKASAKRGAVETSGWMLESDGSFWEFQPSGRRHGWAAPLSFLVQLVRSEFTATTPRPITIKELRERLTRVRPGFGEATQARGLLRHLEKYPDWDVVTTQILKDWPI